MKMSDPFFTVSNENEWSKKKLYANQVSVDTSEHCELRYARETYNTLTTFEKGNELGLSQAAQAEPRRRSEHDTDHCVIRKKLYLTPGVMISL
jgi:hypothetical protein